MSLSQTEYTSSNWHMCIAEAVSRPLSLRDVTDRTPHFVINCLGSLYHSHQNNMLSKFNTTWEKIHPGRKYNVLIQQRKTVWNIYNIVFKCPSE